MSVLLKVPCHSQLNNKYNPSGSCNVTSIAMTLRYYGIKATKERQLEDELYVAMEAQGLSRHEPYDLKEIAEQYGVYDDLTTTGSLQDIKDALDSGYPCVLHGYFTRFGHIITVIGYNDQGFIVNDPYGEWHSWGYDTNASGCGLVYSYDLIARTCSPESIGNPKNIYLHRIQPHK